MSIPIIWFLFAMFVVGVVCWAKGFRDGEKYQAAGGLYARDREGQRS